MNDVYEMNHVNCGNEEMNTIKRNCVKKPEKNSGLQRGLNNY